MAAMLFQPIQLFTITGGEGQGTKGGSHFTVVEWSYAWAESKAFSEMSVLIRSDGAPNLKS